MGKRKRHQALPKPEIANPIAVATLEGILDAIETHTAREVPSLGKSGPALRAIFGMLIGSVIHKDGIKLTVGDAEPVTVKKIDGMAVAFRSLNALTRLEVEHMIATKLDVKDKKP